MNVNLNMLDEKYTKFEPWCAFDFAKEIYENTDIFQVLMYLIYDVPVWYIYSIYLYPIHITMSDVVA